MYVLPTSTTEALVEYTLFSPRVLAQATYVSALKKYIKEDLNIDNYTIKLEEFGVIPMSLAKFEKTSNPMLSIWELLVDLQKQVVDIRFNSFKKMLQKL